MFVQVYSLQKNGTDTHIVAVYTNYTLNNFAINKHIVLCFICNCILNIIQIKRKNMLCLGPFKDQDASEYKQN